MKMKSLYDADIKELFKWVQDGLITLEQANEILEKKGEAYVNRQKENRN